MVVLDERDVAAKLKVSVRTLQRWRLEGAGPKYLKLGRAVRYTEGDVETFAASCARCSTSDAAA